MKPSDEARGILSRLDELHFLSTKAGVYDELSNLIDIKVEAGEVVSGAWLVETLKSLQAQRGIVPL